MITVYCKTDKDVRPNSFTLDQFTVGSWVYVEDPTTAELDELARRFNLERGLLQDAVDPYEVPRIETEGEAIYVFTRLPYHNGDTKVITLPVLIITTPDSLVTISHKSFSFLEKFTQGKIVFSTSEKIRLFLQIFSEIDGAYNLFLNDISRRVRGITAQLERISNQDVVQFVAFESILNDFLSALIPTSTVLKNILDGRLFTLHEKDKDAVEDLYLSKGQLIETCNANLRMIKNIREAYSTIMTHNLNTITKFLTVLAVVLTIPMIISSFYGMNVPLPFSHSNFLFWGIVGFTVIASAFVLGFFASRHWL